MTAEAANGQGIGGEKRKAAKLPEEEEVQAQGGQQLGPPEGRAWVYWADNVELE